MNYCRLQIRIKSLISIALMLLLRLPRHHSFVVGKSNELFRGCSANANILISYYHRHADVLRWNSQHLKNQYSPLGLITWCQTIEPASYPLFFSTTRTSSFNNSSKNDQRSSGNKPEVPVEISPANHGTKPLKSFVDSSSGFDGRLVKALRKEKINLPTPIQASAIPLLTEQYDVMASAQTGSGKTLMFCLPLCQRLLSRQHNIRKTSPSALIIAPTRELAMQISSVLENLSVGTPLKIALATGGGNVGKQRKQLKDCDIIVGTPGRILQFADERVLSLQSTIEVVVDEADRMLDLGFEPQLRRIARALESGRRQGVNSSNERHTILCSATFPPDVQRIASEFLKQNYYFVAAGRVGGTHEGIKQRLLWVDGGPKERRQAAAREILTHYERAQKKKDGNDDSRAIVFCNTKDEAERAGDVIRASSSVAIRVVHGDKEQSERNKSLEQYRSGKVQILVATDVAARGLDVSGIGLVVQVDAPRDIDSFVHRVGRTGRAGATGFATTFLDGRSVGISSELVKLMQQANQPVPSWLFGMSHIAMAKAIDEELAIAAGGGTIFGDGTIIDPSPLSNHTSSRAKIEKFSSQDFRSSAAAGSWGSERDTSFVDFDDEAYASLGGGIDVESLTIDVNETVTFGDNDQSGPKEFADKNVDKLIVEDLDTNNRLSTDGKVAGDEEELPSPMASSSTVAPFVRQHPSRELRSFLKRVSGTDQVGDVPARKVLNELSKRGVNQRLRFEYVGMFPFEKVSDLLASQRNVYANKNKNSNLPRVLMVAEKPSIAQAIADALSGPKGARQRRGISRALPVYEFASDAFNPHGSTLNSNKNSSSTRSLITVTSVVGHVFSLGFVEEKNGGQNRTYTKPSEYFRLPVVKKEEGSTGKLRVVDHLRALAADCDHLVLWLDCDAEGENIAHEVISITRRALEQKAQATNSDDQQIRRIHRAKFSAITKDAIQHAFINLVEPDPALSRSVDARQELDLRVGVAMTRLLTWRTVGLARRHFSPATKLVSYGPCQTPALSFCVDRAKEIEAFKPQDYWKVYVNVKSKKKGTMALRWKAPPDSAVIKNERKKVTEDGIKVATEESATFDKNVAHQVVKLASAPESVAKVVRVENISEEMMPPLGLNTVGLLAAGSKAMGLSPKQVMNVAEKLYSAGFISYPRTETTRYDPRGFDVRAVLRQHQKHPEWGKTASYLLQTKYAKSSTPPRRGYDAGDHPPITTLKAATRDEVGGGAAWRVYEFVTRNFLGSLSDELAFTRRVAELELHRGGNDNRIGQTFEFEQVKVDKLGYAGACSWVLRDINAAKPDDVIALTEGMSLPVVDARIDACTTKPPRFLQEHDLIELMDKNGIGTDASMAVHVNNIVDREYVVLCDETGVPLRPYRPPRKGQRQRPRQVGRYLVPTPLGVGLLDLFGGVPNSNNEQNANKDSPAFLSRPSIRAQMEEEVKQIAIGKLDKAESLEKNLAWFEERYGEFEASLSRKRTNEFAKRLRPTRESLRYWQRLGAFEKPQPNQKQTQQQRTKRPHTGAKSKKPNVGADHNSNKQHRRRRKGTN